ncbi:MAG: hypothetical protein Q7K03_11580 [Dehalococcoidia bacterium]|nr:hypothetical protein [Dehalococcoidia bacterium]
MKQWTARWRRAPQASWRAVPGMNLLEGGGRGRPWVVRAGLALLLLGSVYLLYSLYQDGTTLQREMDGASSRLKATQTELASQRDEVNRLEAELKALRERPQTPERLPQQPGSKRWQAALTALERLEGDGVQFQSLQGSAGGELTVVAVAVGEQPLARLQGRLQEAGQPFELQSVQWKQDKEALILTATLRVRASP